MTVLSSMRAVFVTVIVAVVCAVGPLASMASAQELKIAMSSPPTSMDPHFFAHMPNMNVSHQVFDTLVKNDPDGTDS